MKKTVSIVLALTLLLCVSPAHAAFTDMDGKNEETVNAVNLLYEKNYISGRSDTEFDPDAGISRAEFAAVMLRMLGNMGENRPYYLKDVTKDKWYYYVAGSAAETGMMSGFEDGTFRGDDAIPKIQAAAIAARVLKDNTGADEGSESIPWIESLPEWAVGNVKTAANAGIIDKNEAFSPDSAITRGEAAVMIARVYDKLKDVRAMTDYTENYETRRPPITIVIDPGHGIDSGLTSTEKRLDDGWIYNSDYNQWGEWRHWKSGEFWHDCEGYGCIQKGDCWYRMENGDRETEPSINLRNAQSAANYLESMGYEVRITRGADDNPSMTKRLVYCYPNNDVNAVADADFFVCLHSNAGGGRGSAYIELSGAYDQTRINPDYTYIGNTLGKYINNEIVAQTSVSEYAGGVISGMPELVLFCKSPVPIAYLEIGFYDNPSDLEILNSEYDMIGKAVADGIDKYCRDTAMKTD